MGVHFKPRFASQNQGMISQSLRLSQFGIVSELEDGSNSLGSTSKISAQILTS